MSRRHSRSSRRSRRESHDRGTVYPTLDLHGYTGEEAERTTLRWLAERCREGEPVVRVITGRGKHSIGAPILPTLIAELLEQARNTLVSEVQREPGAFLVMLVRSTERSLPPREQSLTLDPELRREAEHALAELGITPTTVLLEAEIERIVQERRREAE